jgi:RNA polymerase sigma factor (TIGR02999 family)
MEEQAASPDIAQLMTSFRSGNPESARQLVEIFYPELRRIAGLHMRGERKNHTLQATALVNELYLELVRIRHLRPGNSDAEAEKAEFLRLAAHLMRRLLIHHARPLSKRVDKLELDDDFPQAAPAADIVRDVDRALDQLADIDPKLRQVVEMKVFEGLSIEEMATRLDCSTRTILRHWGFARQWLEKKLMLA